MNMLDMYTRERANKIHLDKMHSEAKERSLLRKAGQNRNLKDSLTSQKLRLTLALAALIIMFGSLLLAFAIGS